jgi:hypothetical protein
MLKEKNHAVSIGGSNPAQIFHKTQGFKKSRQALW